MEDVFIIAIVFVAGFLFRILFLKKEPSVTASNSIVMGSGIFLYGAFNRIFFLEGLGKPLAIMLLVVGAYITLSIVSSLFTGDFYSRHVEDPLNAFAIGTWVAGTSVFANVLSIFFAYWLPSLRVLAVFNALLWLFYMAVCIRSFRAMFVTDAWRRVHGIILLSTVSTQSVVILFHNVLQNFLPGWLLIALILLGIAMYFLGFYIMSKRFLHARNWSLTEDWLPSNCIIHGAMSITGLAAASTGMISGEWVFAIWIWVLIWFVIAESVELIRLILRTKKYGFVKGFGQYHVTQWARIFTFGMLYAFTAELHLSQISGIWELAQTIILGISPWVVLALLINEILLFLKAKLKDSVKVSILKMLGQGARDQQP